MNRVIRAVKVFESLSNTDCNEIVRFMRIRQYESGAMVFERGKPGDTMLVVVQGGLSVIMPGPRRRNIEVARVGVAGVVGEMSCIDPGPRSATIMAAGKTTAYELGRKDLGHMREVAPKLATAVVGAIIRAVTLRLRRVDERIERELAGYLAARLPELRQASLRPRRRPSLPGRLASLFERKAPTPGTWNALVARLRGSA
ncbi:MAG TPA: cyclic nucleotide-binding domain-containing protein [Polyangia bacterium]